jgi:hypothetical protein
MNLEKQFITNWLQEPVSVLETAGLFILSSLPILVGSYLLTTGL